VDNLKVILIVVVIAGHAVLGHALGLERTAGKRVGVSCGAVLPRFPERDVGCACLALNSRSAEQSLRLTAFPL
jgi:hypothetical protein